MDDHADLSITLRGFAIGLSSVCTYHAAAVRAADVIVVVSGTDGALPSVVAGLVETPVVSAYTNEHLVPQGCFV